MRKFVVIFWMALFILLVVRGSESCRGDKSDPHVPEIPTYNYYNRHHK